MTKVSIATVTEDVIADWCTTRLDCNPLLNTFGDTFVIRFFIKPYLLMLQWQRSSNDEEIVPVKFKPLDESSGSIHRIK